MSTVAFIRRCMAAGMDLDTALIAAEAFEEAPPVFVPSQTKGAQRTAKWRARKASQSVTVTPDDVGDEQASPETPASCTRVVIPSLPSLRSEELERTPHPSGVAPRHAKPNGFARFWEAYPKKVAKGAAEKAFVRALKRLSGHDPPGQLIEAVARAKFSRQWLEGYVPNPATWLNDTRWEDEIEPPRNPHERHHPDRKQAAFVERLGDIDAAMEAAFEQPRQGR